MSERRLCGDTSFAADFFFQDDATIVEIALGLINPASEFEKDILKAYYEVSVAYLPKIRPGFKPPDRGPRF